MVIYIFLFLFSNCAYLQKRKEDLGDIFSFEVNTKTYGISTRISFLQLGAFYQSEEHKSYGFRNNTMGNLDTEQFSFFLVGSEKFQGLEIENTNLEEKIKDPNLTEKEKKDILNQYMDREKKNLINQKLILRNKVYNVFFPFGTIKPIRKSNTMLLKDQSRFAPISFYTNINFSLGVYYGISFHVNVGEILDFILGIFLIDIFSDDIQ